MENELKIKPAAWWPPAAGTAAAPQPEPGGFVHRLVGRQAAVAGRCEGWPGWASRGTPRLGLVGDGGVWWSGGWRERREHHPWSAFRKGTAQSELVLPAPGAARVLAFRDAWSADPEASGMARFCSWTPCMQQGTMSWVCFSLTRKEWWPYSLTPSS